MHNSCNKESFCMRKVFSWFRILCLWDLDSRFRSLVGFRIPWTVIQIPKPRIQIQSKNIPGSLTWGEISSEFFFWYTRKANVRRGLLIGFFQPFIVLYNNIAAILMFCIIIWPPFSLPHFRNNITGVTSCDFDVRQCAFLHSSGFLKPCMACHAWYAKFSWALFWYHATRLTSKPFR